MKRLFLGGPWDGQAREVVKGWGDAIVVPILSDAALPARAVYLLHRFYLQPPTFQHGPSQTWLIYVAGPMPDTDRVLGLLYRLNIPPEE